MSAVYLLISTSEAHVDVRQLAQKASQWLPFVPQSSHTWLSEDQRTVCCVWSVFDDAARGQWWHQDKDFFVYDGWWAEDETMPMSRSMAHNFHDQLNSHGWDRLLLDTQGEYNCLHISQTQQGVLAKAGASRVGSRLLFYGSEQDISVIGNRAEMVACALNQGQLPRPDGLFMGWLMSSIATPYRNQTTWPSVKVAGPYDYVRVLDGQLDTIARPHDDHGAHASMTYHAEALGKRLGQLGRWPDHITRAIALTGGKDSRAVLAGVLMSGQIDKLDYAYLRAVETHPDAIVGRRLAEHYQIDFRCIEPTQQIEEDFFGQIDRHNIHTAFGLHAWDFKGADRREAKILLHGNLGELYRSHALPPNLLGERAAMAKYSSDAYADPNSVMTPMATTHYRHGMLEWIGELRDEGVQILDLHDRIHRDARMHRWIGHAQLNDGLGVMGINPLSARALLNRYIHSSFLDKRRNTIHHELMRLSDPWLLTQPLANARWSRLIKPIQPRGLTPVTGNSMVLSKQWRAWNDHQLAIRDNLLHATCAEFNDIFSIDRVKALFVKMEHKPDTLTLKSIYGLLGIKRALTTEARPRPFTMETPHAT